MLSARLFFAAALFGALCLPIQAQPNRNPILASGNCDSILAGDSASSLDWAEALVQTETYFDRAFILKELEKEGRTPESLFLQSAFLTDVNEQHKALLSSYQEGDDCNRWRAAAKLAGLEAKKGRLEEAAVYLDEAQSGASKLDQSWLWYEVARAQSQVRSNATPNHPEWGGLLLLRQRCRDRGEWTWAGYCGVSIYEALRLNPDRKRTLSYALEACDDFEKSGSESGLRLILRRIGGNHWPAEIAPSVLAALLERKLRSRYPAAYFEATKVLQFGDPEMGRQAIASAATDEQRWLVNCYLNRLQPDKERLEANWTLEQRLRKGRTFRATQEFPKEYEYLKNIGLLSEGNSQRELLWRSWSVALRDGTEKGYLYNLLLELNGTFHALGWLGDELKTNLLRCEYLGAGDIVTNLGQDTWQESPADLTSGWQTVLRRQYLSSQQTSLEGYRQSLLRRCAENSKIQMRSGAYDNLARYYGFCGRVAEQYEAARKATQVNPGAIHLWRGLGEALFSHGRYQESLEAFEQALKLDKPGARSQGADLRAQLAECYLEMKRLPEAQSQLDEAKALSSEASIWTKQHCQPVQFRLLNAQKRLPEALSVLVERLKDQKGLERFSLLLELAELQLRLDQSQAAEATFAEAEKLAVGFGGGALARLALAWGPHLPLERRTALETRAKIDLEKLAQLFPESARPDFLSHEQVRKFLGGPGRIAERPSLLNRNQFLVATNQLRETYPELEKRLSITIPELVQLPAKLAKDEAFVSFSPLTQGVVVMGCTREGWFTRTVFLEEDDLQQLQTELVAGLDNPNGMFEGPARRLYALLLEPLAAWTDSKKLWIAPYGTLKLVPWMVLQDSQGRFVQERWKSLRIWQGSESVAEIPLRLDRALLLAAPGASGLTGVLKEVKTIAAVLPRAQALLDKQATGSALKSLSAGSQLIHLAAHSSLSRSSLSDSYIELSDGPLRLRDLYQLKLAPQSLVVLSSCQSGLGQAKPGADVVSLGSGFRVNGASQIISTLWPVDDDSSVAYFGEFYRQLAAGRSVAESMSAATASLRKKRQFQHPFYWAAYQLESRMFEAKSNLKQADPRR
jgi:tetratricopeptide (TPR) repeat protein